MSRLGRERIAIGCNCSHRYRTVPLAVRRIHLQIFARNGLRREFVRKVGKPHWLRYPTRSGANCGAACANAGQRQARPKADIGSGGKSWDLAMPAIARAQSILVGGLSQREARSCLQCRKIVRSKLPETVSRTLMPLGHLLAVGGDSAARQTGAVPSCRFHLSSAPSAVLAKRSIA